MSGSVSKFHFSLSCVWSFFYDKNLLKKTLNLLEKYLLFFQMM